MHKSELPGLWEESIEPFGFKWSKEDPTAEQISVGWDIGILNYTECPICGVYLDSVSIRSCGFYKCQYRYEGYEQGCKGIIKGPGQANVSDGSEYHDTRLRTKNWTHLVIAVKPLK